MLDIIGIIVVIILTIYSVRKGDPSSDDIALYVDSVDSDTDDDD